MAKELNTDRNPALRKRLGAFSLSLLLFFGFPYIPVPAALTESRAPSALSAAGSSQSVALSASETKDIAQVPDESGISDETDQTDDSEASRGAQDKMPAVYMTADSALVVATGRGKTLYDTSRGASNIPAASKLMTAVVALESLTGDTQVTISRDAEALDSNASVPLHLTKGEKCSVEYLVAALLYQDSDAAALSLAEYIENDESSFVARMNETAAALGMKDTRFANTSGDAAVGDIPVSKNVPYSSYAQQYTTLNDLSLLFRYALNIEGFRSLFSDYRYLSFLDDGTPQTITNRLVSVWGITQLNGAAGFASGKSSTSSCILALASVEDFEIAVILDGCENESIYQDLDKTILSIYSFYEASDLVRAGDEYRTVYIDTVSKSVAAEFKTTVQYIHPIGMEYALSESLFIPSKTVALPINEGDLLGQVSITLEDGSQIVTEVVASESILSESSAFSDFLALLEANRNVSFIIGISISMFLLTALFSILKHAYRFGKSRRNRRNTDRS